jgi:hypothetical protein
LSFLEDSGDSLVKLEGVDRAPDHVARPSLVVFAEVLAPPRLAVSSWSRGSHPGPVNAADRANRPPVAAIRHRPSTIRHRPFSSEPLPEPDPWM